MLTLTLIVRGIRCVFRIQPMVARCTQYLSCVQMGPFSIKNSSPVSGGSM